MPSSRWLGQTMRHVIKTAPPPSFVTWLEAQRAAEAELSWNALPTVEKAALHARLLEDQGYLCCYCEQRIDLERSHVEHLIPGEKASDRGALDFANLYASCGRAGRYIPNHCGPHKEDDRIQITPAMSDSRAYFAFLPNGAMAARHTIPPDERRDAVRTIKTLNLDAPYDLRAMRQKAMDEVRAYLLRNPGEDPNGIASRVDARMGDRFQAAISAMVYALEQARRRWRPPEVTS
jgi:uncharacterized protein (TIGR02646 family)